MRIRWEKEISNSFEMLVKEDISTAKKDNEIPAALKQFVEKTNPDRKDVPSYIELYQEGIVYTSPKSNGIKMNARQIFSTNRPGFIWMAQGKFPLLINVMDSYISGKGSMKLSLAKLFSFATKKGIEMDESCLIRYVTESVFFPNSLVENDYIRWYELDEKTIQAIIKKEKTDTKILFRFNDNGTICEVSSKRYRDEGNKMTLRTWRGTFKEYKRMDEYYIPTKIAAYWTLESGEYKYVDMAITNIKEWRISNEK